MKISLLGCGAIGYAIAYAFAEDRIDVEFEVYDVSKHNVERCASLDIKIVKFESLDLSIDENLRTAMKGADLVIEALPGALGFKAMKMAAKLCKNLVSVSYTPENPLDLDDEFRKCNTVLIPDAGFAPGLSNLIVGRSVALLDSIEYVKIYVGGLPEKPIGPLGYVITWSVEDLLDEYTRKARIIKDFEILIKDPLEEIERIEIPRFGEFEAFYTDGLRTMLYTLKGKIRNAFEKTLRFPGHLEKIKLLRDLGLLDTEPITINHTTIVPRKLLAELLKKRLSIPGIGDLALMYIEVDGTLRTSSHKLRYLIWTQYDEKRRLSAMSKITGFTAYTMARILMEYRKYIDRVGVIPLEYLGMNEDLFTFVTSILARKGIAIETLP